MIGVRMFKVQVETADGEIFHLNDGKEYELEFAQELCEYVWNIKGHTGNYASFRVVDVVGDVYSELEC